MPNIKLFPYALSVCFALLLPFAAAAQTGESRVKLVGKKFEPLPAAKAAAPALTKNAAPMNAKTAAPMNAKSDEPVLISLASAEDIKASKPLTTTKGGGSLQFHELIMSAIDERLGSRYSWGATGPSRFDCSGFVWSTFQAAGIGFERASARTLWSRFSAPALEDQFKFGNLVFFSNLAHVGIVADEHGFYHASRHHGVVYSPFNEYWLKRIDGFRKVPVAAATIEAPVPAE